jgi:TPR repeat protein
MLAFHFPTTRNHDVNCIAIEREARSLGVNPRGPPPATLAGQQFQACPVGLKLGRSAVLRHPKLILKSMRFLIRWTVGLLFLGLGCLRLLADPVSDEELQGWRKDAERGGADGQCSLGAAYAFGRHVEKDGLEAVKWLRKAADQGHGNAQSILGMMYSEGYGIPKDEEEALKWTRKSAEGGDFSGQLLLGSFYRRGYGVPKDASEAVKWFLKSANQGFEDAQRMLGFCYETGEGVQIDLKESFRWYERAAKQGNCIAQGALGRFYATGKVVPMDGVVAYMWLNLAAAGGNESAGKNREVLGRAMTPEQIGEAQKLSREWKAKQEPLPGK